MCGASDAVSGVGRGAQPLQRGPLFRRGQPQEMPEGSGNGALFGVPPHHDIAIKRGKQQLGQWEDSFYGKHGDRAINGTWAVW